MAVVIDPNTGQPVQVPDVPATQQIVPQTGLIGSEQALGAGLQGSLAALQGGQQQARQDVLGGQSSALQFLGGAGDLAQQQLTGGAGDAAASFGRGAGLSSQFIQPGQQAQQVQAALSGALGQGAFDQAVIDSPQQAFLREQGQQALLKDQTAIGGTGGGNVRRELVKFGQGLASQGLQQQIGNLNALSGQGLQAAGQAGQLLGQQGATQAGLAGQGANLAQNFGQFGANLLQGTGQQLAGQAFTGGQNQANLFTGAGQNIAQGRLGVGQQLQQAIGGTSSALANLQQQQGAGISDITGSNVSNLANILSQAGLAESASQEQLAAILANISTGQGSTVAGLGGLPGTSQVGGIIGNIGKAVSAGAQLSDMRLKENIVQVGSTTDGLNLYLWDWTDEGRELSGGAPTFGVMAQEAQATQPEAVTIGEDGFLRVNYGMIH